MSKCLFFDTETTGLDRLNDRLVDICFIETDEYYNKLDTKSFIIKRDNFSIYNYRFHGITNEISDTKGVPIKEVAKYLHSKLTTTEVIMAHNISFDKAILINELECLNESNLIEILENKIWWCTSKNTKNITKLPMKNRNSYKMPKLAELYKHVFNKDMMDAHRAEPDTRNMYNAIKKLYDDRRLELPKLSCSNNVEDKLVDQFSAIDIDTSQWNKYRFNELQELCEERKLLCKGKSQELKERLQTHNNEYLLIC